MNSVERYVDFAPSTRFCPLVQITIQSVPLDSTPIQCGKRKNKSRGKLIKRKKKAPMTHTRSTSLVMKTVASSAAQSPTSTPHHYKGKRRGSWLRWPVGRNAGEVVLQGF